MCRALSVPNFEIAPSSFLIASSSMLCALVSASCSFFSFSKFSRSSIFSLSTNKGIASNHDAGGIIEICNDGNCLEEKNRLVLNNMAEQLKHFHKETELSKYYSIGWDVMIKNENGFSIPYCLEGNAPHSSWFYPDHMPKDLINRYRQGFIKEYKGL